MNFSIWPEDHDDHHPISHPCMVIILKWYVNKFRIYLWFPNSISFYLFHGGWLNTLTGVSGKEGLLLSLTAPWAQSAFYKQTLLEKRQSLCLFQRVGTWLHQFKSEGDQNDLGDFQVVWKELLGKSDRKTCLSAFHRTYWRGSSRLSGMFFSSAGCLRRAVMVLLPIPCRVESTGTCSRMEEDYTNTSLDPTFITQHS